MTLGMTVRGCSRSGMTTVCMAFHRMRRRFAGGDPFVASAVQQATQ